MNQKTVGRRTKSKEHTRKTRQKPEEKWPTRKKCGEGNTVRENCETNRENRYKRGGRNTYPGAL